VLFSRFYCFGNETNEEEMTLTFGTPRKARKECKTAARNPDRKKPFVDVGLCGGIKLRRVLRR
jgi:hypothetical protein